MNKNPRQRNSPLPLSRRRQWLFRLIAGGLPTLCGLVILVGFLSWWRTRPIYVEAVGHDRASGQKFLFDRQLGWRNIPNRQSTTFGEPLQINSLGLRDREYVYEKPAGTRRILVLGDSYTWGFGVANQDIFTEVLEERLAGRWQVLNAGVSGWGTDQEFLFLKDEGFRYSPDLVIVAFYLGNDPKNNVAAQQYGLNKPVFLGQDLRLANSPVPWPGKKPLTLPPRDYQQQLRTTFGIFQMMAAACRARDCSLVIMKFGAFVYPGNQEFARFEQQFQRRFADRFPTANANIHYLDLDPQLQSRRGDEKILRHNDDHWNPLGHRLTAEILEQFLRDEGLLQ